MLAGYLMKDIVSLLDTYILLFDIKNDIEVREYDYPNGFFEEGFSADKITSSE